MHQSIVRDLRAAEVEESELGQLLQVLQSWAGDIGAVDIQRLGSCQPLYVLKVGVVQLERVAERIRIIEEDDSGYLAINRIIRFSWIVELPFHPCLRSPFYFRRRNPTA